MQCCVFFEAYTLSDFSGNHLKTSSRLRGLLRKNLVKVHEWDLTVFLSDSFILDVSELDIVWSIYSDLTRPHPKR